MNTVFLLQYRYNTIAAGNTPTKMYKLTKRCAPQLGKWSIEERRSEIRDADVILEAKGAENLSYVKTVPFTAADLFIDRHL